jgi:hypothetical protein
VPKPRTAPAAVATSSKADDDFWDEALREEVAALPIETKPTVAASAALTGATPVDLAKSSSDAAPKKKKRKKSGGIKWGFDWGKVVGGLAAFVIFGGLAVALFLSGGRIKGVVYLAVPAIVGLFTAINGLMGEEGIW